MMSHGSLPRLARHVAFDIFFGAVVVSNAIFIGVDVGLHVGQRNTREAEFKVPWMREFAEKLWRCLD